jgi:hypothetical protein
VIPRTALWLGLAGVLPFAAPVAADWLAGALPSGHSWAALQFWYGVVILSFMSGSLWGFAARGGDAAGHALSTLPALAAFALVALLWPGVVPLPVALLALAALFLALLPLDARTQRRGDAPGWWMQLRLLLTGLVVICLGLGAVA